MDDEEATTAPEPVPAADEPVVEELPEETPEETPVETPVETLAEATEEPAPVTEQLSLDEMVDGLRETPAAEEVSESDAEVETPAEVTAPAETAAEETVVPPVVVDAPEVPAGAVLARARLAARLPFWILAGVWAAFVGVMTYLLWAEATKSFTALPLYAGFTLGGVGLTVAGPLLGVVVWLLLRRTGPELRGGLVRAMFLRVAVATLAGNLMWWVGLVVLDLHRSGVV